ncbi:MAG: hypothetical protein JNJ88_08745 [Planctomycetes bacterium]|nr:hypothetical protein [Planctomycetota bacterium]
MPRRTLPVRMLVAGVLLLLAGWCPSCASTPEPKWVELPVRVAAPENLHEACLNAVQHASMRVAESNLVDGKVTSAWSEDLFAFRRPNSDGGTRRRAWIEVMPHSDADAPNDGRVGRLVRVRVERERNKALRHPDKSAEAEWDPVGDDVEFARRIAFTIQAQVGADFRPSDDFYRRMGTDAGSPSGEKKNP